MSTSASTQNVLTIIKDKFAEVITEGTLSPTTKPTDWNVIITEKALLETTKTPSPPPEQVWHGLASPYDNTFPTHEEYREFAANRLAKWGNTLDYKLFDTLYLTHRYHTRTIKNLWEQARLLLEEADKINKRDKMVRHEIKTHILNPIFDRGLGNLNKSKLSFPPLHFLVHLDDPITPTWLPMVGIMHIDNINALNAAILPISNETVPFTNVEHVEKQHLDMHHDLVMDISMMMESMDIMTLMAMRMETSPENVDLRWLFVLIYFSDRSKSRTILLCSSSSLPLL
jgi:hypothetical protein